MNKFRITEVKCFSRSTYYYAEQLVFGIFWKKIKDTFFHPYGIYEEMKKFTSIEDAEQFIKHKYAKENKKIVKILKV